MDKILFYNKFISCYNIDFLTMSIWCSKHLEARGLCDEMITRPEESYRLLCASLCVIYVPQEWGGHSPRWDAEPKERKKQREFRNTFFVHLYTYFCTAQVHGYLTQTTSRNPLSISCLTAVNEMCTNCMDISAYVQSNEKCGSIGHITLPVRTYVKPLCHTFLSVFNVLHNESFLVWYIYIPAQRK